MVNWQGDQFELCNPYTFKNYSN